MKTWLTLRLDADGSATAEARASDDMQIEDETHTVTESVPLDLPEPVLAALGEALKETQPALAKRLNRSKFQHAAAVTR